MTIKEGVLLKRKYMIVKIDSITTICLQIIVVGC